MSSSTSRSSDATTWVAALTGLVLLGALAFFAIGLPRLSGDEAHGATAELAALPATLPGGWKALEDAGADGASQKPALDYVNGVLDKVYADEPTEFQAYLSPAGDALVTATVFGGPGRAFAPPNGVADPQALGLDRAPVELTREGDAVCIANYQSAQQTDADDPTSATPLSVSCQLPHGDSTVMLGSQGMSVAATVTLLKGLESRLA